MEVSIKDSITTSVLEKARKLYNIHSDISYVGGFENFVYEFKQGDESFILRFVHSNHRVLDLVLAEIEFIDYLDENNASVSTVIHSVNDNIVEVINLDNDTYLSVCVFTKAPGTYVKRDQLNDTLFEELGRDIGRLHKLVKTFEPTHKRGYWFEESYVSEVKPYLSEEDLPMIEIHDNLQTEIKSLERTKDNFGLIHTDLHFGNMYLYEGKLTFFDFDDAGYKHFLSDIAIVLFYQTHTRPFNIKQNTEDAIRILKPLLKGYQEENTFDYDFLKHLNTFLRLRMLILYLVLVATNTHQSKESYAHFYVNTFREAIMSQLDIVDLEEIRKAI